MSPCSQDGAAACKQGGKDVSDKWGVTRLADLSLPKRNLVGVGAQGEGSLCSAALSTAITKEVMIPLIPAQLNRYGHGQHARPLSSAGALMGPKWIPESQAAKRDVSAGITGCPKRKKGE